MIARSQSPGSEAEETVESAVVLGPGGPVGTAWLAGLAAGLRREGVDLGAADLIVGTSAGAIVGAVLACGGDLDRLTTLPAPENDIRIDQDKLPQVFAASATPVSTGPKPSAGSAASPSPPPPVPRRPPSPECDS
ncbi:hypothetical protein Acor_47490 [Acrocarpospora corrugata]|uniref:PNPLA domain-containing protein n=1 Tax=Acrocarpospora corrugata TaxID=35763 RepID=A0A5M3W5Y8_9ACTN|nr:patatin-like phospholipase family protein [Acrocarpospora corrugata]GES02683.1 hypothetical protein Acor_47490 [Acrocarpospora corrugata]